MRISFSEQYGAPCLVIEGTEDADEVIARARRDECVYFDDEEDCLVIEFPDRFPELYTETALRGSLRK